MSMEQNLLADFSLCASTLGALFSYNPSDKRTHRLIELFQSSEWVSEWPYSTSIDSQQIDQLFKQSKEEKETLENAYQRLFKSESTLPAAPWGSVYLDKNNALFGITTLELRAWLRNNKINVQLAQDEPEDHIGFLLLLAAWLAENKPELLQELLEIHLLPWAYSFFDKMQQQSQHAFYRACALLSAESLQYFQQVAKLTPVTKPLYI